MQQKFSLLPVPCFENERTKNTPSLTDGSEPSSEKRSKHKEKAMKTYKSSVSLLFISVFLCLLSLFSLFICLFAGARRYIGAEKILGYITSDFLGIDPSEDDRNLYEILMSGSFGDPGQNKGEDKENGVGEDIQNRPSTEIGSPSNEQGTGDTQKPTEAPPASDNGIIPEGEFAIVSTDLSSDKISISNQTEYKINIDDYIKKENTTEPYAFEINENMTVDPLILIIHTHGTEAYSEEGSISYSEDKNIPRSEDIKKNIVAVGSEMARVFNENGIPTLHCTIMHDKESYKNSYQRAAQTIEKYLEKYPSIKYVFDVHRDSVISESGIKYKPITTINGDPTAQVMFVLGSDYNTPEHKDWRTNLTLALKLTEKLNESYSAFTRRMSLRQSSYNQEYTQGSLLLEIGSCGNTLSEAKRAGIIVASKLSEMIKQGW